MNLRSRKLCIWLISFIAVLVIYFLYNFLSATPRITLNAGIAGPTAEANIPDFGRKLGQIGQAKVGSVVRARYTHLDENKNVDSEFGFERLLHQTGITWKLQKPFMTFYKSRFHCDITADSGDIEVETVAGTPSPSSGVLNGNVIVHIVPTAPGNIKESFIYLDDVAFTSEKSEFSTDGPVKFLCKDIEMIGTGMRFVHNEQLDRLELLRIIDLERLCLTITPQDSGSVKTGTKTSRNQAPKAPAAKTSPTAATGGTPKTEPTGQAGQRQYSKCVFRDNVVISYAQQIVLADEVSVNNLLWSSGSSGQSQQSAKISSEPAKNISKKTDTLNNAVQTGSKQKIHSKSTEQAPVSISEPEETVEVIITCDNGIEARPMGLSWVSDSAQKPAVDKSSDSEEIRDFSQKDIFGADKIDYDAITGDMVAAGPVEYTFYTAAVLGAKSNDTNDRPVPVKITAEKLVKYSPADDYIVFEGSVVCTIKGQPNPLYDETHKLYSEKLIITLGQQQSQPGPASSPSSAGSIRHIRAIGGIVKLESIKTSENQMLSGVQLKCSQIDFDADDEIVTAAGPGLVWLDNARASAGRLQDDNLSIERRCYATANNFDKLLWFINKRHFVIDGKTKGIHIGYLPVVDGRYGQRVLIDASHIEADFIQTPQGDEELATLTATGGVYFEQADRYEISGSRLFYDAAKSLVTIDGDANWQCFANGIAANAVKYDLKTGRATAELAGRPGVLNLKRLK